MTWLKQYFVLHAKDPLERFEGNHEVKVDGQRKNPSSPVLASQYGFQVDSTSEGAQLSFTGASPLGS